MPKSKNHGDINQSSLNSLIYEASRTFEDLRNKLNLLETQFINQLTCFYTSTENTQKLKLLEEELRRCHHKILHKGFDCKDSAMFDELSLLLAKYKQQYHHQKTTTYQEKMTKIEHMLTSISSQIDTVMEKAKNSMVWESFSKESQDITEREYEALKKIQRIKPEMLEHQHQRSTRKGLEINLHGKDSFLFTSPNFKNSLFNADNNQSFYIADVNKEKILFKGLIKENIYSTLSPSFRYVKSLNMIVTSNPVFIVMYRLTARGLKKITQINPSCGVICGMFVLEPDNILALCSVDSIVVVDLITRRIICKYYIGLLSSSMNFFLRNRKAEVRKIFYVEKLRLFAIVSNPKIDVYRIELNGTPPKLLYTIPLEFPGFITEIYTAGDIIVVLVSFDNSSSYDNTKNHAFILQIFELNQHSYTRSQLLLKSSDLPKDVKEKKQREQNDDEDEDEEEDDKDNRRTARTAIRKIFIRPDQRKLRIIYDFVEDYSYVFLGMREKIFNF